MLLVTRRQKGVHLEGYWEFPGGKCDAGESLAACLARELREELAVDARVGEEIFTTTHTYPDRRVELHFLRCELHGEPLPQLGQEMRWVAARRAGDAGVPAGGCRVDLARSSSTAGHTLVLPVRRSRQAKPALTGLKNRGTRREEFSAVSAGSAFPRRRRVAQAFRPAVSRRAARSPRRPPLRSSPLSPARGSPGARSRAQSGA